MELLLHWMRKQQIDDEMIYKNGAIKQEIFIRDNVCTNLLKTHAFVIGWHRSKSIILPVYYFTMRNGIKVICRENFYGWKLSVKLPYDRPYVDIIPKDLISEGYGDENSDCFFEGFKTEWVFDGYKPDDIKQRNFSIGIHSDYSFYVAMYMLSHLYEVEDFTKEADKISKEYIIENIKTICDEYGYNEFEYEDNFPRRLMSDWEIFWLTYHHLTGYDFAKEHGLDYGLNLDVMKDLDTFADNVLKYPEVRRTFAYELSTYKFEF